MTIIVLDFETSGLNPYHEDIIEIGAKVLSSEQSFQCLVRPESNKMISDKITKITGITNRTLRAEGKQFLQAYNDFYNWLIENMSKEEPNALVAHNGASFDFIFFRRMINTLFENKKISKRLEEEYKIVYLDTLFISRRLYPQIYSFKQETLCKYFGIKIDQAHRAFNDVICLEQLMLKFMSDLQGRCGDMDVEKIDDFIHLRM
jgi:DNA polymerase III alpha subunit (gram-positive type)